MSTDPGLSERPTAAASAMFRHGIGSGAPTRDGVTLWTHTSRPCTLRYEVFDRIDDGSAPIIPEPADQPVAIVEQHVGVGPHAVRLDDLGPSRELLFRCVADGELRSGVARTRTLPAEGAGVAGVDLGIACCARRSSSDFGVYRRLAERTPDLVVHLGDYIYEDGDPPHDPSHRCVEVDDYRTRYSQYRGDPHLIALHERAPMVTLWDDHEIANDSWRSGHPGRRDRGSDAGWERRRLAALAAHDEWLPRGGGEPGPTSFDRRLRFGDLVDVVVVDARHAARSRPARPSGGPALVDPERGEAILSPEQWAWLSDCVREAPAWLLLATQVQVSRLRLARLPDPRRGFRPTDLVNPGQWDGYPAEQRRLGRLLAPLRGRVSVLSGDLHGRFVTSLGDRGASVPELTTPSVASVPFAAAVRRRAPIPAPLLGRWLGRLNPHIDEMELTQHGATLLRVEHGAIVATAIGRSGSGASWRLRRGDDRWRRIVRPPTGHRSRRAVFGNR